MAAGDGTALLRPVGSEEARCAADCEGKVFQPPGEAEVAYSTAVDEVEMVTKALARGASGCAESCVQYMAVKCVCLDAENGADDVRAMLDDGVVLGDRVDEFHRAAVDAAETSQRRKVNVQQDLDEKFCWKLVELAGGITRGVGRVGESPFVKRTPCHQLRIV